MPVPAGWMCKECMEATRLVWELHQPSNRDPVFLLGTDADEIARIVLKRLK